MEHAYNAYRATLDANAYGIEVDAPANKSSFREELKKAPEMKAPTISDDGFFVKNSTWLLLARNLKRHINTILIGQTGTGKTELCMLACQRMGIPCRVYDMGSMHDPLSQLLGTHRLKAGQSVFEYARFVEDVQQPGVILLDELSRAPLGTANILMPCLDSRRMLPVEMAGGDGLRSVSVHPECTFIATANVGAEYTGTFSMDRALTGRFFPIEFQYMPEHEEATVLKKRYAIPSSDAMNIAQVAQTARDLFNKGEVSCTISTRETLAAAALVADGWTSLEAMEAVFLPLFEGTNVEGERSVISKVFMTR
jgi:MoxR-like ATPase